MRRNSIVIVALVGSLIATSAAAFATSDTPDGVAQLSNGTSAAEVAVSAPDMVFPIVGEDKVDFGYYDTFGAPRSGGRTHKGVDIGTYGVKGVPIVAVAAGTIGYVNWSSNPNDLNPERCCTLTIDHEGGWSTWYIHLDNDTQGTDDGKGWGLADGIVPGATVYKGQLVGWVGDSGNAENVYPMLHWEVHDPSGIAVNPTPYADAATRISAPLAPDGTIPPDYLGAFGDDEGSVHEANIDIIASEGITKGCNPPDNDRFCPEREITRGEMAAFLRRMLMLPGVGTDFFADDGNSIFEGDINALADAGIAFGCSETDFCPGEPLLREEMAELLVRAFGYENPDGLDVFVDDDASSYQASINALGVNGITKGCNPPDNDNFCPYRTLSRAEMATFFARALGLGT